MHANRKKIAGDLRKVRRGDVFSDILHRSAYSSGASIYRIVLLCVVAPRDIRDVAAVVKYARAENIPVVARGAASGVAGESLGSGIVFDMTRYMNKVISISDDGGLAVCEPGVVLEELNAELSAKIAEGLKEALEKSAAKVVLTECAACKMQIEHISNKIVRHPIKIVAEAYS